MDTLYLLATDPRVLVLSPEQRWHYVQHLAHHNLLEEQNQENQTLTYAALWGMTYDEADDFIWSLIDLGIWGGL